MKLPLFILLISCLAALAINVNVGTLRVGTLELQEPESVTPDNSIYGSATRPIYGSSGLILP